jgi:hypothetical protein
LNAREGVERCVIRIVGVLAQKQAGTLKFSLFAERCRWSVGCSGQRSERDRGAEAS